MQIPTPANCKNARIENHVTDIDDYATNNLEILDSSIRTVTMRRNKIKARSKVVPGWSDGVKPFWHSMFWHAIWTSSGKLNTTHFETNKELIPLYKKFI